ncbi:hypothetical protein Tco_0837759 [Tanacetum coccineum]
MSIQLSTFQFTLVRDKRPAPPSFIEPFNLKTKENPAPLVVTMDDNRTMAQLLEAPTEGYEDAIVVPEITMWTTLSLSSMGPLLTSSSGMSHIIGFSRIASTRYILIHALNSNDQDSLNSAAGANFLDKMPRDCLIIIESKSKVRNSRNKPVVAKVSLSSSTPDISPDVAELKDMVKAF